MHIELDIEERAAAVVPLEALADLTRKLLRDEIELPYSPPLCLAKDIKRQFGSAGFVHWFRLMRKFEPPYRKIDRRWLQDRRYDWEDLDTELKGWCDYTIVDALATARAAGAGHPSAEAILDDLAKRSGAKRAAIQAEIDAKDAAERAAIDAEIEAEYAVYEAWLAAGEPPNDPLADDHRSRKRRIRQARIEADHRVIDEWLDREYAANEIGDDVPSDDPRFAAHVKRSDEIAAEHKAKIAEWEARHGGLPAIRALFLTDRRIPPGTSVDAMQRLRVLWQLPVHIQELIGPVERHGAVNMQNIPPEYHEAVYYAINAVPFDRKAYTKSGYSMMPTPPQLSIVPAEPAPDYLTSSRNFLATFEPPEFLIDETVQMRYFYSLTAATGVGKTAIAMRWMGHVVLGRPIGEREVQQGDVLYLAGENPSDVLYRWMALSRDMGIDPETERVTWMVGAKDLTVAGLTMATEAVRKGKTFKMIIVDTAAAYNFGDNENDNSQAGAYARQLRSLVNMPGGPCVIALCHPTKRAADDDLMPRGGGAFIAEVDGNMAVMKKEGLLAVVPFGKFRGDTSWSHHYELEKITDHPKLVDARGRQMASVIARPIASTSVEIKARNGHNEAITLLHAVFDHPGSNATDLARQLRWTYGKAAEPHKNKVNRLMESLVTQKLVRETMGRWKVTSKGQEALNDADNAAARAPRPVFPIPGVNS